MQVVVTEGSELHPNRKEELRKLGEWLKLDQITYRDRGNKEEITLHRGNEYVMLTAWGNQYDGGWLSVETREDKDESSASDIEKRNHPPQMEQ